MLLSWFGHTDLTMLIPSLAPCSNATSKHGPQWYVSNDSVLAFPSHAYKKLIRKLSTQTNILKQKSSTQNSNNQVLYHRINSAMCHSYSVFGYCFLWYSVNSFISQKNIPQRQCYIAEQNQVPPLWDTIQQALAHTSAINKHLRQTSALTFNYKEIIESSFRNELFQASTQKKYLNT